MKVVEFNRPLRATALRHIPLLLAALAVAAWLGLAPHALAASAPAGATNPPPAKLPASVTLEGCVTSSQQAERSVTFAGEMSAVKGAVKMEMRVDVLERLPKDLVFHSVYAPGLGIWRMAAPGVSNYKYLKEITNLAAPASYRAVIRFRWLNAKGHAVKAFELRTPRCVQPLEPGATKGGEEKPAGTPAA
ncbi:MAG TPA: hypothetical protein VGD00_04055 [Solirubrobacteraceae bacterium]